MLNDLVASAVQTLCICLSLNAAAPTGQPRSRG
jgi:hypothetical protein